MKCKFIDVDCNCLPNHMPADCNDECWVFWQAQNTKNVEEGNKAINANIDNQEKIGLLQDKLSRRNALIKKLREEIRKLKDQNKEAKDIVNAFDLDGVNDYEHLEVLKETINR